MKRAVVALLIIGAVGAGAGAYYLRRGGQEISANTAPITQGDIVDAVGATGTVQAVTTVQVGSQVSGNIQWLGADFNTIVKKGQVIAKLDPSLFQAQVDQARANHTKAQADVVQAQANVERAKVVLLDAQQKFNRSKELMVRGLETQANLDATKTAVDSADAALQSSQAGLNSSRAVVGQAQANLNQAQVNLDHTIITSPIDGIVTQRSVDVGQTVAASMQAPTLFILAADLTKMQVNANIDEADVGRIRPGQRVTFRVDAYPTEQFEGTVTQVRLQPVVVSNVTTYGTIISVPNAELKLKPGMTANLKVEVMQRFDVLRVPNTGIRFRPSLDIFAALNQPVPPEAQPGGRGGRSGQGGDRTGADARAASGPGVAGQVPAANPAPNAASGPVPGASVAPTDQGAVGRGSFAGGSGWGGFGGGGGQGSFGSGGGQGSFGGGGGQGGDRRAQAIERFKSMSPDDQKQFIARMKDRGQDAGAFEAATKPSGAKAVKSGAPQSPQTIDGLFAPIPAVETRGRVWLFINKQLKPVNVRLGITDGTNTELLSGELQENMEVVTSISGVGNVRPTAGAAGGNPLLPQRGGGPGRGR